MITLKQWMEVVNYRITEGSNYLWDCYGPDSYMLDSWNGEQDGNSFTIIFDTKTQEVYEVAAHDYPNGRAYRLISANYQPKVMMEATDKDVDFDEAWDDVSYTDLESDEDWLEKARAIFAGKEYDTRVSIPVDFSDDELLKYMTMAHERDMTFNQFIEEALRHAMNQADMDIEAFKAKYGSKLPEN